MWASALVVAAALAVTAAGTAMAGKKKQIAKAGTPTPELTIDSVKADLADMKEKAHR